MPVPVSSGSVYGDSFCPLCGGRIVGGVCDCSTGWVQLETMNSTSYPFTGTGMYSVDEDWIRRNRKR